MNFYPVICPAAQEYARANTAGNYLVDIGPLIPTFATSARSAYTLAVLAVFGNENTAPADPAIVYRLSDEGEILEIVA